MIDVQARLPDEMHKPNEEKEKSLLPTAIQQTISAIASMFGNKENMPDLTGKISKKMSKSLAKTYEAKGFLPKAGVKKDGYVIVYRGCKPLELVSMAIQGSAGGLKQNANTSAPSEEAALNQVAELSKLPEFTFNRKVAQSFGLNNCVVAVEIHQRYLTQGSKVEDGVVAHPDAPVKILAWHMGNSLK